MNFVEKFLTKHHLIHKPHKWFLALISSPIHAAEKYYERKYELNYGHARKLFIFDMILVLSVVALSLLTLFWFLYDPGVDEKIQLKITKQLHGETTNSKRLKSGEHITYIIKYSNNSEVTLEDAKLTLDLPDFFEIESITPKKFYTTHTKTFSLPKLQPGTEGKIKIEGFYFGEPGVHERLTSVLNYKQEKRKESEQKIASVINILQGSYLQTKIQPSRKGSLPKDQISSELTIKNTYHHSIKDIYIPLENISMVSSSIGKIKGDSWRIENLAPQEQASADINININAKPNEEKFTYSLTPKVKQKDKLIPQQTISREFTIISPKLQLSSNWSQKELQPGEATQLNISLKNNGKITLNNLNIKIPVKERIINKPRFKAENNAVIKNGNFIISKDTSAKLTSIAPNQSKKINIKVPIERYISEGEDIKLTLEPSITANVGKINKRFAKDIRTEPIKVGTSLSLSASTRYYTPGGDQLGRGPLPPIVGATTKYWVFITFRNTTSEIENIEFTAKLAESATWTGKTSVSQGQDLQYNSQTNTISWGYNKLPSHSKAGLYMQLSLTPTPSQTGTTPQLLKDIELKANDSYINKSITKNVTSLDTSLPQDKRAQKRGVEVR
ncbi:MAG: hypothetical protein ABEJ24_02710 [Candidatus Magasanikbacteria bacterium]